MSRHLARALFALAFAATLAPARAQTAYVPPTGKPLALEEAVGLALKKNFDLQIQTLTAENAKETVKVAGAGFDPTLTAAASRSVNQAASNTSRLDGTQTEAQLHEVCRDLLSNPVIEDYELSVES